MLHRTAEELQSPLENGLGDLQRKSASILIVPLWQGERVMGALSTQSYAMNAYTDEHAEILTGIGHQAAIAIENAQLYEQAQQEIVERRRVQAEREQLIAELEAKNTELEQFTYTVSHDLKSPLITIRGFIGFIEQDTQSGNTNRLKADIQRISDATDKMQRLLNELLELSRIGRLKNEPKLVPFEELVREAVELMQGRIMECGVEVHIDSNLPNVFGDSHRLLEVLQNLVDNAAKFMGDQPKPRIEIGQRGEEDGKPVFFVRDNGIGIAPEYHERVFGLFNKLDPNIEGTGVGLALVKRIVELHGGRIWVESEAGKGATFFFTLSNVQASEVVK
jgi:signal transduction histidine kinase